MYAFRHALRSTAVRISLLIAGLLSLWFVSATVGWLVTDEFDSYGDALWIGFRHMLDPATLGEDQTGAERALGTFQVLVGLAFFVGLLFTIVEQVVGGWFDRIADADPPVRVKGQCPGPGMGRPGVRRRRGRGRRPRRTTSAPGGRRRGASRPPRPATGAERPALGGGIRPPRGAGAARPGDPRPGRAADHAARHARATPARLRPWTASAGGRLEVVPRPGSPIDPAHIAAALADAEAQVVLSPATLGAGSYDTADARALLAALHAARLSRGPGTVVIADLFSGRDVAPGRRDDLPLHVVSRRYFVAGWFEHAVARPELAALVQAFFGPDGARLAVLTVRLGDGASAPFAAVYRGLLAERIVPVGLHERAADALPVPSLEARVAPGDELLVLLPPP